MRRDSATAWHLASAQAKAFALAALVAITVFALLLAAAGKDPLRAYADNQPLTATVNAVRPLLLGGPVTAHAVAAVIWCLGIIAVFAPLSVLRHHQLTGSRWRGRRRPAGRRGLRQPRTARPGGRTRS